MDANAPKGYLPEGASRLSSINVPVLGSSGPPGNSGGSTILGKANKIDPYYLIAQVGYVFVASLRHAYYHLTRACWVRCVLT